jgi:hypothetical protein
MYKIKLLVRPLILIAAVTLAALFVSYRAGVFRLDLIAQETTSLEKEGATANAAPPVLIPMISLTSRTSSIPADMFLDTSKSGRVFTKRPSEVPTMAAISTASVPK